LHYQLHEYGSPNGVKIIISRRTGLARQVEGMVAITNAETVLIGKLQYRRKPRSRWENNILRI
jgi:hypothetical protein